MLSNKDVFKMLDRKIFIAIAILVSLSFSVCATSQISRREGDILMDISPPPYIEIIKQTGFETNFTYSWTKIDDYTYQIEVCHIDFEKNKDFKLKAKDLGEYPVDTFSGQKPNKLKLNLKNQECDSIMHTFEKGQKLKFGEESTIIQFFEDNITMIVSPENSVCEYLNCKSDIILENNGEEPIIMNLSTIHLNIEGDYEIYFYQNEEYEYDTFRCLDESCLETEPTIAIGTRTIVQDARSYGEITLEPNERLSLIVEALMQSENSVYKYDVDFVYLGQEYEIDPYFYTTMTGFDNGSYYQTYLNASGFVQQNTTFLNGSYISEIFDAGAVVNWNTIQWFQGANYGERLPSNGATESGDFVRKVNMNKNILLYRMDESGATIYDDSGNNFDGTYNGSLQQESGIFNYSINFSDRSRITAPNLGITNHITISSWARIDIDGNFETLISKLNSYVVYLSTNTNNFAVYLRINGSWNNNKGVPTYPITGLIDNTWHHFAVTYNTTEHIIRMYLDGKQVKSLDTGTTLPISDSGGGIVIGDYLNLGNRHLTGNLDEFAIFNRSLSANEIKLLYERGATKFKMFERSCNDGSCSGETWSEITEPSEATSSVIDNRFYQYKAEFYENTTNTTAQLWNVSINYDFIPSEFNYVVPNFSNNSRINLSTVSDYFKATFYSWNESSLVMEMLINGTSEQNVTASNATLQQFTISSITNNGSYTIEIRNKYNTTGVHYFEVVETASREIDRNINYIAIAFIMVAIVAILTYIGRTSENEIIKMFFSMLSILSLTGLSHIAYLISRETLAFENISIIIFWFTVTFALVSMFMFFYTLIVIGKFSLQLMLEARKEGSLRNALLKRKGEDIDNPFK